MGSPSKKAPSGPYADKLWREALRKAVLKRVENEQRLDRIAEKVVAAAEEGELAAAKEIGDRLDGKAAQSLTVNSTVTHDLNGLSDGELESIIAAERSRRVAAASNDKERLH